MTTYYCPKCEKITSKITDLSVLYNRPCRFCGTITIPNVISIPPPKIKEIVKAGGDVWKIHKYDQDVFPSDPHAHNKETGEKLNLFSGNVHSAVNKKIVRKLSKKKLDQIWQDSKLLQKRKIDD